MMAAGDLIPMLSSVAGVANPVCIAGMVTRGAVPGPLMGGHPLTGLVERGLVPRSVSTDGAAGSSSAHPVFNLGKLSAQFGVAEHREFTFSAVVYYWLFYCKNQH